MKKLILMTVAILATSQSYAGNEYRLTRRDEELVRAGCNPVVTSTRMEYLQTLSDTMIAIQNRSQFIIGEMANMSMEARRAAELEVLELRAEYAKCTAIQLAFFTNQ
jgi:hypothetical protein